MYFTFRNPDSEPHVTVENMNGGEDAAEYSIGEVHLLESIVHGEPPQAGVLWVRKDRGSNGGFRDILGQRNEQLLLFVPDDTAFLSIIPIFAQVQES